MNAVYSNASQVLIYLGFRPTEANSRFLGYLDKRSQGIIADDPQIDESLIKEFLQHPYFNRVWVLQEISLAKLVTLYTDYETIHWDAHTVRELMRLCDRRKHDPPGVLHWLPATQRDEHDCLDLLHRARRCMATDPRDKVFALYSFFPLSFREALPIDYALSTRETYGNIATHLIFTTGRLDVLKHVPPHQPLDLDVMPSWVPDWNIRQFTDTEWPNFTGAQSKKFAVSASSPMSMSSSSTAGIQPQATHKAHDDHQTQLSSRHDPVLRCRNQNIDHHHPTLEKLHTMKFSTIPCLRVRGCLLDRVTQPHCKIPSLDVDQSTMIRRFRTHGMSFLHSRVCCSRGGNAEGMPSDINPSDEQVGRELRLMIGLVEVMASSRGVKQAFETQQSLGFVLRGPMDDLSQRRQVRRVESGDTIWAIEGLDIPVILRRRTQEGKTDYVLIQPCYLHRAGLDQDCPLCGSDSQPWLMEHATIDIW